MPAALRQIPGSEARLDELRERTVAVLGFGAQGHAHALNLRDAGCRVLIGQRPGRRAAEALSAGFEVVPIEEAVRRADLLIFGLPDDAAGAIYAAQIAPHLRAGQTLGFIHGFAIHYRLVQPPTTVSTILVAPKAQGHAVRGEFLAGRGVLALVAVHHDADGRARDTALAWAAGIGAARAGILETTFADETETDLFGEQAVLCGGLTALITAGFETLVAAGYPPELAYFECCHEVKIIADLIHSHGIHAMRERISSTARYGDVTRGGRIVNARVRAEMQSILAEIRSGEFAREFLASPQPLRDASTGAKNASDAGALLEAVGARMRALMWGARETPTTTDRATGQNPPGAS